VASRDPIDRSLGAVADAKVFHLESKTGHRRRFRGHSVCTQGIPLRDAGRCLQRNTTSHADSISLLFFDRFGSVHPARLKQHGRRFPLFIFEMLTSTRRLRVSGFGVALTQRTHSQRAIGVTPFHRSWIF
jgi:hypothetical protein